MGHVEKVDKTLPLNEMVYWVRRDPELRGRWRDDFAGLAREFGLSRAEIDAVERSDVRWLAELGVHQYLISQITRLTFGTSGADNLHAALEAFRRAYSEGSDEEA